MPHRRVTTRGDEMAEETTGQTCVVYCRSWCGDCRRALQWMDEMGYDYELVDIEQVPAARDRVVELAGKVITPTFEIGERCIVDFRPDELRDALGEPPSR